MTQGIQPKSFPSLFPIRDLLFLLVLCFVLYFWKLGELPFYDRGEPREGLVVQAMVATGNWILPIINDDYIPFKPPLFHWFGVFVAALAGRVDELITRFPSALFGTLGALVTYLFAARWWNRRTALMAGIVLATNIEWWQAGTITQVDMTLAFFISATLMLFYAVYQEERYRTARSLLLAGLLALSTLAKGPLGVAVPSFVIFVFLCIRRDLRFLKKLPFAYGTAVFLIVAGSWYSLAYLQGGWAFFRRQIIDETLLTGVGSYGHHQPLYYFFPVLLANLLPWSFFVPGLAFFLLRRRRRLSEEHLLYPIVWFVATFVFFSLPLGKRGIYILPLYPAAAILFGAWWHAMKEGAPDDVGFTGWIGLVYAISGLAFLAIVSVYIASTFGLGGGPIVPVPKKFAEVAPLLQSLVGLRLTITGLAIFAACLLLLAWASWTARWTAVFTSLSVIAVIQIFVLKDAYLPYVASVRTMKPFVTRVIARVDADSPLLFYRGFDYGTLFYSHRNIPSYATSFVALKRPYFLLMWEEDVRRLSATNRLKIWDISEGRGPTARHRLVLVQPQQDTPIVDPQGYARPRSDDSDSDRD